MKQGISLALAAAASAMVLTGCGGRMDKDEERVPDVTVVTTEHTETTRSKTVQEAEDMASDAVEDVSEAVSDAAEHGRSIATGLATDASEMIADRKGDGDYRTDEDGAVQAQD